MTNQKADLIEQLPRWLAGLMGISLWAIAAHIKSVNPLIFLVGSGLVFVGLNGRRFSWFSLGKDSIQFGERPQDIIPKVNRTNTPEITTLEPMPAELCKEAEHITATINTDGMGAVKIVSPSTDVAVGIGNTLSASGVTEYSPIVGIGLFGSGSTTQPSVLVLAEDSQTFKINYSSQDDQSSPVCKE
jgi:hypothetical protein